MLLQTFKTLNLRQKEAIQKLWNAEYPKSIQHSSLDSLEEYLSGLHNASHTFLTIQDKIEGWLCVFERNNEPFFAMILSRNSQGKGYGKQLLQKVQQEKNTLYGWVVVESDYIRNDGLPYPSPLNFYLKMGFQLMNEKWETTTLKMERIVWSRV